MNDVIYIAFGIIRAFT